MHEVDFHELKKQIQNWGKELGFQQLEVSDLNLSEAKQHLQNWLEKNFHGSMEWMANNVDKRSHPASLHEGTVRIISARMDYRPEQIPLIPGEQSNKALISCYASGRDYHKTLRKRLTELAKRINQITPHEYRAFVDSAPVLERALAEKSGLGWIGKNSMLINKDAGSWFFLGELFTNLPLPVDESPENNNHCGTCSACMDSCPTGAIVAPYQVDARKCISYLTIENKEAIPEDLRPLMGNRIFGCDDCQIVCPWNKFSDPHGEKDFSPREYMQDKTLAELFLWDEEEFLQKTEGTPLRRIGYQNWLRNIAVALGNAEDNSTNREALSQQLGQQSALVDEHIHWAVAQLEKPS